MTSSSIIHSQGSPEGYLDYYEKTMGYITVISAPAKSLDGSVSEINYKVVPAREEETVFNYYDTNASLAEILNLTSKLEGQKVAIIGLGGTGSYILDLVAKTPVAEIHLYDGDQFLQHNAFRSTGAPSIGNWSLPCRSHYWIKRNEVRWAESWSDEVIRKNINRQLEERINPGKWKIWDIFGKKRGRN